MSARRSADARIALGRVTLRLIRSTQNGYHAGRQTRGRGVRELRGAAFELGARSGSQSFGPADQHEDVSRSAGNDSWIGGLALPGFRRFSVGSIHWSRCLVVVVLR